MPDGRLLPRGDGTSLGLRVFEGWRWEGTSCSRRGFAHLLASSLCLFPGRDKGFKIQWVDDTHALGVFPCLVSGEAGPPLIAVGEGGSLGFPSGDPPGQGAGYPEPADWQGVSQTLQKSWGAEQELGQEAHGLACSSSCLQFGGFRFR